MTEPKDKKPLHSIKPLPADHPIFSGGFIVGQTFSGATPADARALNDGKAPSSTPVQMTEAQIQAELQKMREAGYGTAEIAMAEALMKGLEGKPEGSA